MATRDMRTWETSISQIISTDEEEEIIVRGRRLSELIGSVSFADMMFLMLQGQLPEKSQSRVLDALLVASMEHGIAPPSMISRCFASYGTSIQSAVGGGILAFGDRMGGLGEQLAKLMSEHLAPLDPAKRTVEDLSADLDHLARAVVDDAHTAGERVPGYGIPLHNADPRAPQVLEIARQEGVFGPYCAFATRIEQEIANRRAATGAGGVPMNLDGVGAAVILDLGFDWRTTRMFLLTARSVSMGAHFLEEQGQDTTWRHVPASDISYEG